MLPELGRDRLRELTLPQLQRFVDGLAADGLAQATTTATITPLRAIYRRARQLGEVQANPTSGLSVPSINRRQTRFATVEQIEALLSWLDRPKDRALWATALYAGLRRGELQALHREDVDLATGVIRVERGWDQCEGEVPPKSKQGRRRVPIPAALRDRLLDYLMDVPTTGRIFVGARDSYDRGREAAEDGRCRAAHAARVSPRLRGTDGRRRREREGAVHVHGPRQHRITLDQYGHLLPGRGRGGRSA